MYFSCTICNKSFRDNNNLKIHMDQHAPQDELLYQCDICDKKYSKKYKLFQHLRLSHISRKNKSFKCEQCGRGYICYWQYSIITFCF